MERSLGTAAPANQCLDSAGRRSHHPTQYVRPQVDSFRRLASHQAVADSEPIEPRYLAPPRARKGAQSESWVLGWPSLFVTGEGCYRQGRTG